MSDTIHLSQDYSTNGTVISAGKVSTDDLKELFPVGEGDKQRSMTDQEARAMQQELMQREGKYQDYLKGIHVKRDYTQSAGSMSMGGSD